MASKRRKSRGMEGDPLWYKDAVIYEVHPRAFFDANNDGIGDFCGLHEKLPYLQELGVSAIWLLPFYPSPLKDDGYDISDYLNVHQSYGSLRDFSQFLKEAHERGIRVITELVINHTSDQHPWFQRARRARKKSRERNFYVWSDNADKYREARIIFQDFENSNWTWDPLAKSYYWHRFYSHQPDLNFENPAVGKALLEVMKYWLEMGVDGLRLDAVPYLYEEEGTDCENLPRTHKFLKQLRQQVDNAFASRMLLAEANQWPEEAVQYFGQGDECQMAFHFPLMPRMFMSLSMEDRFPIIDILHQTPVIPENCQWALFLRNHDELTLEMVTDEERDYMYRAYAKEFRARVNLGIRRRLAPLVTNDRRNIELLNVLLFSLPGTPVIYYGDEIGMGDNIYLGDRNGVRTPMQWNADKNAGFSRANPQSLYLPVIIDPEYHYEAVNVENQRNNPRSLLRWMQRLISIRKHFRAFGRGSLEFLQPENRKVLAFLRRYEEQIILVVANLSGTAQFVELDLRTFGGMVPLELFGQVNFPAIGELPYLLTLAPSGFYWFLLRRLKPESVEARPTELRQLAVRGKWNDIVEAPYKQALEELFPAFLMTQRWFGAKARKIRKVEVRDWTMLGRYSLLCFIQVEYLQGEPDLYVITLEYEILEGDPPPALALLVNKDTGEKGILRTSLGSDTAELLFQLIWHRRKHLTNFGELKGVPTRIMRQIWNGAGKLPSWIIASEQSNTSIVYGEKFILKLIRRLQWGLNPDLELSLYFTETKRFRNTPRVAGYLHIVPARGEPVVLGILQEYLTSEGIAWDHAIDSLHIYFERAQGRTDEVAALAAQCPSVFRCSFEQAEAESLVGGYLEWARLLGQRTAEMHLALAAEKFNPNFTPEPFSDLYQRSLYQSMRNLAGNTLRLLEKRLPSLPPLAKSNAERLLAQEGRLLNCFHRMIEQKFRVMRIRIHGDYHLGQVLFTGKDFMILDFEGEPARSLTERRLKRSVLRDVIGMLRSYHYAAYTVLQQIVAGGAKQDKESDAAFAAQEKLAVFWYTCVGSTFFQEYLSVVKGHSLVPDETENLEILGFSYLLDKAVYELAYELNNRPHWVNIPLVGLLQLLEESVIEPG